ncbi:MAG: SRPBCC family protein [Blastocatellia bacterium]
MRILKRFLLGLVSVLAVLVVVGFLLPASYRVERSVTMRAKPEDVFHHLHTLKTWPEWTAWNHQRYPDMKVSFRGPDAGIGATYDWDGKDVGQGYLTITAADPNKGIEYDLNFQNGEFLSKGGVTMAPAGEEVKVTWVNEGQLGSNPVNRYFGLMMDRMMGPDFEAGLMNLKQKLEGQKQ